MIEFNIKVDKRFLKTVRMRFERYDVMAGVLQDKPHFAAKSSRYGFGTLEGGPVRKKSARSATTTAKVGEIVRKTHKVDYLRKPFRSKRRSLEVRKFVTELVRFLSGRRKTYTRVETALRRAIRRPIITGQYGVNTPKAVSIKGFNRFLIDTGQFYRSISAKIRRRRNVRN